MVQIDKLFSVLDQIESEYLEFFKDIVSISSYSTDKSDIDQLGLFIKSFAESKGLNVKIEPFDIAGNGLLITMNEDSTLPAIVFTGHLDTVFPRGTFQEPLFRVDGDKCFGPGVFDMKGGLVVGLMIMDALKRFGYKERPVKFIMIPDEERSEGLSGEKGKDFIRNNARGAAAAFTLEGRHCNNTITVGRKGSVRYRVTVHGKAAHAGMCYALGRSAIKEAAHKILDIEEASNPEQITYNCGMIEGGTSPNTVPEFASFMLYNRYWTFAQREELMNHVEAILNKNYIDGTSTSFEVIGERHPMEAKPANYRLFDAINETSKEIGMGEFKPVKVSAGSDASYTTQVDVPSVCSVGPIGDGAHQLDEWCSLSSVKAQASLLAATIVKLPEDF